MVWIVNVYNSILLQQLRNIIMHSMKIIILVLIFRTKISPKIVLILGLF